jgi:hypothetical protein
MHAHTPRRLIALTRSKTSAGSSAASLGGTWMPALLNAMSSRSNVSTVAFTMAATLSSSDTSTNTKDPVASGFQLVCSRTKRGLVDVRDDDRRPRLGERACGGKAHAGAPTRHQCYLSSEIVGRVHGP